MGERNGDFGRDPAGVGGEHDDPVRHQHRFLDVVGHHQDRLDGYALLLPQFEQVGAQRLRRQHVERGKGLVHQQHFRLHDERARKTDALPHAAGQLLRIGAFETVEADRIDRRERALAGLLERHADRPRPDLHIVEHVEPGEQRKTLEHHRAFFGRPGHWLAVDRHLS